MAEFTNKVPSVFVASPDEVFFVIQINATKKK